MPGFPVNNPRKQKKPLQSFLIVNLVDYRNLIIIPYCVCIFFFSIDILLDIYLNNIKPLSPGTNILGAPGKNIKKIPN